MEPAAPVVPAATAAVPAPRVHRASTPRDGRASTSPSKSLRGCRGRRRPSARARHPSPSSPARGDDADETYRLTGTADALRIEAASETGAVRGIYDLAAQVRAGRSVAEHLGEEVTSRLPFRMVDMGAVGVDARPGRVGGGRRLLARVEGVRRRAAARRRRTSTRTSLAEAYDDFDEFIRHSLANGYNAVAFPGLRRVRHVRRGRRTAPSTPRATSTARRRSRCARRSGRSGSTPTSSA